MVERGRFEGETNLSAACANGDASGLGDGGAVAAVGRIVRSGVRRGDRGSGS